MALYAQIKNGAIVRTGPAPTQPGYEESQWFDFSKPAVVTKYLADYGWVVVNETARPADTATTYHQQSYALVGGVPTTVWTPTPKTAEQQAADTAATNGATIRTQAATALDTNATYLAIAAPTNAQIAAQVKALTRQSNGLIRLTIGQLDSTA